MLGEYRAIISIKPSKRDRIQQGRVQIAILPKDKDIAITIHSHFFRLGKSCKDTKVIRCTNPTDISFGIETGKSEMDCARRIKNRSGAT